MWYSWNSGLVHWVSVDTELWDSKPYNDVEIQNQYRWLKVRLLAYTSEQIWISLSCSRLTLTRLIAPRHRG